jgi:hypothetical protein
MNRGIDDTKMIADHLQVARSLSPPISFLFAFIGNKLAASRSLDRGD